MWKSRLEPPNHPPFRVFTESSKRTCRPKQVPLCNSTTQLRGIRQNWYWFVQQGKHPCRKGHFCEILYSCVVAVEVATCFDACSGRRRLLCHLLRMFTFANILSTVLSNSKASSKARVNIQRKCQSKWQRPTQLHICT